MTDDFPREHPFGQTKYRNFNPEQVNNVSDAVELLEWISDENAAAGELKASEVFADAADMLSVSLLDEGDE